MIGPRIAALRRQAGLSQSGLAELLKISPSTVGMYEQERREPSLATVVEMAKIFGVSTDYLLTGTVSLEDRDRVLSLVQDRVEAADRQLSLRQDRPFTAGELLSLFASVLMEGDLTKARE